MFAKQCVAERVWRPRIAGRAGGLIGSWERGEMLARRCQQWLDGARERLDDAVAARRPAESE